MSDEAIAAISNPRKALLLVDFICIIEKMNLLLLLFIIVVVVVVVVIIIIIYY